ncbi:MAG: hypothetical protein NXI31_18365 [bacterium]|nr:hypothetical protein [bacterium]
MGIQDPAGTGNAFQNPQGQNASGQNPGVGAQNGPTTDPDLQGLIPVWTRPPAQRRFQGFPIFPGDLPGVGAYPRTLAELAKMPIPEAVLMPGAPIPVEPGWPEWLRDRDGEEIPYEAEHAVLVRSVDRVWYRPPEEEVFVPLYFYDKLRELVTGSAIQVRRVGEFEVLLHGGGRLRADGPTELRVAELSAEKIELDLRHFTRFRIEPEEREHHLRLPDGSVVIVKPQPRPAVDPAAPATATPPAGGLAALLQAAAAGAAGGDNVTDYQAALLLFERLDEPGRRSPRATIWNGGDLAVEWRHAYGTTVIPARHRVVFFLAPVTDPIGGQLTTQRVNVLPDGAARRCEPVGDGEVTWSGAQFRVGEGAALRLDPMLGDPFAPSAKGR